MPLPEICCAQHISGRRERDPERWQTASQLVTHALLRDAGFTLPPRAEAWEDLSVDFPRLADSYHSRASRLQSIIH